MGPRRDISRAVHLQRLTKQLVQTVGVGNAIQIAVRWGGRELSIPSKLGDMHPLCLTLGPTAAYRLVNRFGGRCLRIPPERSALVYIRNRMMAAEHVYEQQSFTEIGNQYGVSRVAAKAIILRMIERGEIGLAGIELFPEAGKSQREKTLRLVSNGR